MDYIDVVIISQDVKLLVAIDNCGDNVSTVVKEIKVLVWRV
jgi:hypothetical protein